jgi:hypothetical protein
MATFGVVVVPVLVVVAAVALGLPEPQIVFSTVLGLLLSFGFAAVASTMWLRRPESVDVAFGELMLWRFLRRHRAEQTIEQGTQTLGMESDGWINLHLAPETQLEVLHDLTSALEAKDPYTHGHSRRVERHVYRTAMALGLAPAAVEELRLSAALHDVGKIRIPERVLRKPGALNDAERQTVQEHCLIGAELVASAASPRVTEGVRSHHEYWDGAGYPDRLAGDAIPLFARIIAVADAYDAMTSARPYKTGCNRKDAVEDLRSCAGSQFDPVVVEAFITTLPSALPVAGALLVFALPSEVMRRVSAWAKATASGSVATAAAFAGLAILVGTASIGGSDGLPRRSLPNDSPSMVTVTDTYAVPVTPIVAMAKATSRDKGIEPRVLGIRERVGSAGRASGGAADTAPGQGSGDGPRSGGGQGSGPAPQGPGPSDPKGPQGPKPDNGPPLVDSAPEPGPPNEPGPPAPPPSGNGNPPDEDDDDKSDKSCKKGKGHYNDNPGKGHAKHDNDDSDCD